MNAQDTVSWAEAVKSFYLHKRAVRALGAAVWYPDRLSSLVRRATGQSIPLPDFTKRHPDAYLAYRADLGIKPTTLRRPRVFSLTCRIGEPLNGLLSSKRAAKRKRLIRPFWIRRAQNLILCLRCNAGAGERIGNRGV